MRFNGYLNEAHREYKKSRSQELEYPLARAMIESNCKEILNTYRNGPARIYRGATKNTNIYFTNPNLSKRMSPNTLNFYTVLFDNLPSWKNYPKRGNGIICSSTEKYAAGYGTGNAYLAFPYDGTKIAACPRSDMWEAFHTIVSDLDGFNHQIASLFYKVKIDLTTKASLAKTLASMESKLKTDSELLKDFSALFMGGYDGKELLIKFFNQVFNPDKAGFNLYNTSNYNADDKKEVWFDGSAVMVRDMTLLAQLDVSVDYSG